MRYAASCQRGTEGTMRHTILALSAGLLVVTVTLQIGRSPRSSMLTAGSSTSSNAGALAAAPGATFAPRPLHLVIPSPPPLQPWPLTSAAAPRRPKRPSPRPLATAQQPDAAIPPSMILAPAANVAPAVNVASSPPPMRNLATAAAPAEPAGDPV